jgi:hypothetical protein
VSESLDQASAGHRRIDSRFQDWTADVVEPRTHSLNFRKTIRSHPDADTAGPRIEFPENDSWAFSGRIG